MGKKGGPHRAALFTKPTPSVSRGQNEGHEKHGDRYVGIEEKHRNSVIGRITGGEIEFQFFPQKNIELFGHFFYYKGKNTESDIPLNDISSPKLLLGGKIFFNRLWTEINFIHSFYKGNPGPAEIENLSYNLLNLKGGYYFTSKTFLYLKLSNLFNETYYSNPDPDIPESRSRSLSAGIQCYF